MAFFVSAGTGLAKPSEIPAPENRRSSEISGLRWEFAAGPYLLSKSASTFELKKGLAIVRGRDARRLVYLSQGQKFPDVEAVLIDPRTASGVIFTYLGVGYVRVDDWAKIDPNRLLKRIRKVTEEVNRNKRRAGLNEVSIAGWLREPTLDHAANSVHWAIEAIDGTTPIVNAVTLKLGKNGFAKMTWIGRKDLYLSKTAFFDDVRRGHRFDPGFRYADYTPADKTAKFGIASLVAASAGAGGQPDDSLAGLFAKHRWIIWFVALAAAAAVTGAVMRGHWRRREAEKG